MADLNWQGFYPGRFGNFFSDTGLIGSIQNSAFSSQFIFHFE